jgi:predicted Fe-S protein YdhL (DUF1289 family)
MKAKITAPCIKVCAMERSRGWCLGCGRTGREIARWWNIGEAERAAVRADLPKRLAAMGLPPRGNRAAGLRRAYEQSAAAGEAIVNGTTPQARAEQAP